jgi:hypothetical protein
LRTYSAVILFIEDFTLTHDFAQEPITFPQPPLQVLRRADEQVHRKGRGNRPADLNRLIDLVTGRHDDQKVHVAAGKRNPMGVPAEQDDLLRLKDNS